MFSRSQILHNRQILLSKRTQYVQSRQRSSTPPQNRHSSTRSLHSRTKHPIRFVHIRNYHGESLYTTIKRVQRKRQLRERQATKKQHDRMVNNMTGLAVGGFILGWLAVRLHHGRAKELEEYEYGEVCGHVWRGSYP